MSTPKTYDCCIKEINQLKAKLELYREFVLEAKSASEVIGGYEHTHRAIRRLHKNLQALDLPTGDDK